MQSVLQRSKIKSDYDSLLYTSAATRDLRLCLPMRLQPVGHPFLAVLTSHGRICDLPDQVHHGFACVQLQIATLIWLQKLQQYRHHICFEESGNGQNMRLYYFVYIL